MIVILGESGCGKSTLVNDFVKKNPEYYRVVTYTTRPKRDNEVDGVDYHFVSGEWFAAQAASGFFIEHNEYRGWYYGTAKEDCEADNAISIVTPAGLRELKRKRVSNIVSIHLEVDRGTRLIRLINRGDDIEEAYRRNLTDVGMFDNINVEVDYVIANYFSIRSRDEMVKRLEEIIKVDI